MTNQRCTRGERDSIFRDQNSHEKMTIIIFSPRHNSPQKFFAIFFSKEKKRRKKRANYCASINNIFLAKTSRQAQLYEVFKPLNEYQGGQKKRIEFRKIRNEIRLTRPSYSRFFVEKNRLFFLSWLNRACARKNCILFHSFRSCGIIVSSILAAGRTFQKKKNLPASCARVPLAKKNLFLFILGKIIAKKKYTEGLQVQVLRARKKK